MSGHGPARFESDVVALLAAGGVLALFECLRVFGWGRALFLSSAELGRYALAGLDGAACFGALAGAATATEHATRSLGFRVRIGLALSALLVGGGAGWALTAGRRVRDLSARPLLAAGFAVLLALGLILGMRTATFVRTKGARGPAVAWALVCFLSGAAALVVDAKSSAAELSRVSLACCSSEPCWQRRWPRWDVRPTSSPRVAPQEARIAARSACSRRRSR